MLASHLVLLAACETAWSVSLSSWDVWGLDVCVFECTSRGVVDRDGQRVTQVNGKSAKPRSHNPPPLLLPEYPPSHAFVHPSSYPAPHPTHHYPDGGLVPAARLSIPAVILDHVGQLDDELAFFILLTALKGMFLRGVGEDRRGRQCLRRPKL